MGSSSVPYKTKRLITKKELEKKVFQQGSRGVSVYAIVAVVYYTDGHSPYHTGKGHVGYTQLGTFNKPRNLDEIGWLDEKRRIAYELNFGKFLEDYIENNTVLPDLVGRRDIDIELEVNRAWKGYPFAGGTKPLTKKFRLEILDLYHGYIHGLGLRNLQKLDTEWLSEDDDPDFKEFISYNKGTLGRNILDYYNNHVSEEEAQEFIDVIDSWVGKYEIDTRISGNGKDIIGIFVKGFRKEMERLAEQERNRRKSDDDEYNLRVSLRANDTGLEVDEDFYFGEVMESIIGDELYNAEEVLPFLKGTGFSAYSLIEHISAKMEEHGFYLETYEED